MSAKSTTNFRSYEAQARLLAAVIATAKPRLDYKEIARHMGSDATPSAVDHRLRPIKQLAKLQDSCLKHGGDPKDLPVEKTEIQKLFGESTPQGLEFHFRQVKAIGKAQQEAVDNGGDPTGVAVGSTAKGKGKGVQRSLPSTPATSRKRAAPASGLATTGGRGRKQVKTEPTGLDDAGLDGDVKSDVDSPEDDYDGLDIATPSKPRPRSERNPAYTVNNSTSSSDMSSPAVLQTYAQTQAQIQARARENPQNQDFFGQQPAAAEQQRQSIFGGPTPSAAAVAPSVEKSEDELMEIDGAQFSARKPAKGKGVAAAAPAKKQTKKAKEPVVKNDGMYDADGLSSVPSLYSTSDNYAFSFGDAGDDYADGEV
ncbi:hypothetical protein LQW54_005344 [Pestalotiopsis sp. IQ-011]